MIRKSFAFAFFFAMIWPAFDQSPARWVNALAFGGFAGICALVVLIFLDYAESSGRYDQEEPPPKKPKDQDYEMVLEVIDGSKTININTGLSEFQTRKLFADLLHGKGAYHECYHGGRYPAYTRHELKKPLDVLASRGIIARDKNYDQNSRWVLTDLGFRAARELEGTTPLPRKDRLILRVKNERTEGNHGKAENLPG